MGKISPEAEPIPTDESAGEVDGDVDEAGVAEAGVADKADTSSDKTGEASSGNDSVMEVTEKPREGEIFDWVEYQNEDGSYTKGAELKAELAEQKPLTESDLKDLTTISEEDLKTYQNKASGYYFYNRLNSEEQVVYAEMYYTLDQCLDGVKISSLDVETSNRVYEALWKDHAELFYVEGCSYMSYLMNDELAALVFTGSYNMDKSQISAHQTKINQYVEGFMARYYAEYPNGSDDYGKIKCWYEYVINNTEYDLNSPNNQTILSVMENGRSVCQGYARTTQYVLSGMGIETLLVIGTGRNGETHAWNEVYADGNWYHVDATWGDASYEIHGSTSPETSVPPVNYDYLLVNDTEILKSHTIRNKEQLPQANAMADNYYVREGLYFTEVNPDYIAAAFAYARLRGMSYVTLKMDNEDTFVKMKTYLLEEQKIFDFLDGDSTVSYAINQDQNSIVFWL